MKKIVRLTESDLSRIVRRVIRENNDHKNIESSDNEDWKLKLKSYESKMDDFLRQLKDSGTEIDKLRFLKKVQKETDQMYWDVYDNSDSEPEGFAELQLNLMKRFRQKLNESDLARIVKRTIREMEDDVDPQSMLESMIDEIGENLIENSYFGSLAEDEMESFSSTVAEIATERLKEEGFSNMRVDFTIYYGGVLEFFIFDDNEEEIVATYRPDFL